MLRSPFNPNQPSIPADYLYGATTTAHELGHALGLSHPMEQPFNKAWDSSDTVMSYNKGDSEWSSWFSQLDLQALKSIWGR